jgi:hypothetical protein
MSQDERSICRLLATVRRQKGTITLLEDRLAAARDEIAELNATNVNLIAERNAADELLGAAMDEVLRSRR